MSKTRCPSREIRPGRMVLPGLLFMAAAACSSHPQLETAGPVQLAAEVRSILGNDWRSPEYHRDRNRLLQMGPEIDSVLVSLVQDAKARAEARADALVLLADRRSPHALPTLERALQYDNERLRAAAVQGLGRLAGTSNLAMELIRRATADRSRTVRLNALENLDVADVATFRAGLEREKDPEVRMVAAQLALSAESRGAPLARDARGALRTTSSGPEPQIVFRPVTVDSVTTVGIGDLRVEIDDKPDIPLAASALVVGGVVGAFFSPDRSAVVAEDDGQIRVFDIGSGASRTVGPGIAPRPVPLTYEFVFLRERDSQRLPGGIETHILYDVYKAAFTGSQPPEPIGQLRAIAKSSVRGGQPPVRWMVVAEDRDGFVLQGDNIEPFRLPTPVWRGGRPNGATNGNRN